MVRVNILEPSALSDQHLIAEYSEILRLLGYVRKHPEISSRDTHFMKQPVKYFSDKLLYLKRRHSLLKSEMKRRGFRPMITPDMKCYSKSRMREFSPDGKQVAQIKRRIITRLRHPPWKGFYRYERKNVKTGFLVGLVRKARPA